MSRRSEVTIAITYDVPHTQFSSKSTDAHSKHDAKELVVKKLRTGQIAPIEERKKPEIQGFKRSKALEKRRLGADKPGGYQPFEPNALKDEAGASEQLSPLPKPSYQKYNLYDNFVSAKDVESIAREETNRDRRRDGRANYVNRDVPHQGNTVYVKGVGLNENLVRNAFSDHGNILNISMEPEKNCAFVTFESIEEANLAIQNLNERTIEEVKLHVSLARRQPHVAAQMAADQAQKAAVNKWISIASSHKRDPPQNKTQKNTQATPQKGREQVSYADNPFD